MQNFEDHPDLKDLLKEDEDAMGFMNPNGDKQKNTKKGLNLQK